MQLSLENKNPNKRTASESMDIPRTRHSRAKASREKRDRKPERSMDVTDEASCVRRPTRSDATHDPRAVQPAVAAMLAMTSIHPPRPKRSDTSRQDQRERLQVRTRSESRITIDELVEGWKSEDDIFPVSLGSKSPMHTLLKPPDTANVSDSSDGLAKARYSNNSLKGRRRSSVASRETVLSSSMSLSSDSIPSLDGDEDSSSLSLSDPTTPSNSLRRHSVIERMRKERQVHSPPAEDCVVDHPLLPRSTASGSDESDVREVAGMISNLRSTNVNKRATSVTSASVLPNATSNRVTIPTATLTQFRTNLKSNLTASLQVLATTARSFSNFTAPSLPPEDLLTKSLLSPRYPSEMRPKPMNGVPGPALRRYLNPTMPQAASASTTSARTITDGAKHLSTQEFVQQLHRESGRLGDDDGHLKTDTIANKTRNAPSFRTELDDGFDQQMIQLEPFDRGSASNPLQNRHAECADPPKSPPLLRPREPRENSDFLRIIVLEMNMRRVGKLAADAPSRARFWLPPRRDGGSVAETERGDGTTVANTVATATSTAVTTSTNTAAASALSVDVGLAREGTRAVSLDCDTENGAAGTCARPDSDFNNAAGHGANIPRRWIGELSHLT